MANWAYKYVKAPIGKDAYTTKQTATNGTVTTWTTTHTSPASNDYDETYQQRQVMSATTKKLFWQQAVQLGYTPTRDYMHETWTYANPRFQFIERGKDNVSGTVTERTVTCRRNVDTYLTQDSSWSLVGLSADIASIRADAEREALNRIADHSFNAAVTAAEFGSTAKMVLKTATKIARAYSLVRKGKVISAAHVLTSSDPELMGQLERGMSRKFSKRHFREYARKSKPKPLGRQDAANAWLEMKYGWQPLLSDVKSAAEALAFSLSQKQEIKFVKSGKHEKTETINGWRSGWHLATASGSGYSVTWSGTVQGTFTRKTTVQRGYVVRRYPGSVSALNNLGLMNPAVVAWELVPLSFVIDWFVPIGDWLHAASALRGWEVLDHWESVLTENKTLLVGTPKSTVGQLNKSVSVLQSPGASTYRRYHRTKLALTPSQTFSPKVNFSKEKFVTSLSLLSQRMR